MDPDLRELIEELRANLEADQPASLVWAQIRGGVPAAEVPAVVPTPVRELMEVADGILAGDFWLVGTEDVEYRQAMLAGMPEPGAWFYLGTLHQEPVLLRRDTGAVWWFPRTSADPYYARDEFEEAMPNLEYFLAYYVFGPGYADVGSASDRWASFLEEHGLTTAD